MRWTVKRIAKEANCHPQTVRRLATKNLIDHKIDMNGWRIFPNPQLVIKQIQELLCTVSVHEEEKKIDTIN